MNRKETSERFVKFGKITGLVSPAQVAGYHLPFHVTEKIDGGNCQIRNLPTGLVAGSRANYLHGSKLRSRQWFELFNAWMHGNSSLFALPKDMVLFGEWSGNHTIDYGENNNKFFFLDLVDANSRKSLPYDVSRDKLNELGIQQVSFLETLSNGTVSPEELSRHLATPSSYYNGPREGVVLRNDAQGLRLKLYHPDFADKIMQDDGKLDCLTPARFRKAIFYLIDETKKRTVSPSDVVERVRKDTFNEERQEIDPAQIADRYYEYSSNGKLMNAAQYLSNL